MKFLTFASIILSTMLSAQDFAKLIMEITEDGIHPTKLDYEKMETILMKNLK